MLRDFAPKVTIYRFGKYQEGQPLEVQLKFDNQNVFEEKVHLLWNEEDDSSTSRPVALPASPFTLDPCDSLQQPPARSAFEDASDDAAFLYKKMESFAIIKIALDLEDVDIESAEASFSLLMRFNTFMYNTDQPLDLSVPVFINIGKVRRLNA